LSSLKAELVEKGAAAEAVAAARLPAQAEQAGAQVKAIHLLLTRGPGAQVGRVNRAESREVVHANLKAVSVVGRLRGAKEARRHVGDKARAR
jgi:hypothetical protein